MLGYLIVGLAGFAGALLRYYIGVLFNNSDIYGSFPIATFTANMIGSFLLGWVTARLSKIKYISPYLVLGIGTGLIGSFTTFSTFSVETVSLIRHSYLGIAFSYVSCSLIGGLILSYSGYKTGNYFYYRSGRKIK